MYALKTSFFSLFLFVNNIFIDEIWNLNKREKKSNRREKKTTEKVRADSLVVAL
jgi:hypothetical protein